MWLRAGRALLPSGLVEDVAIRVAAGRIAELRPGRVADGPALDGVLLPGLVNAHLHLELGGPPVPGGDGLPAWVAELRGRPARPHDRAAAARAVRDAGTVAVFDVGNGGDTAEDLDRAGLVGVAQHELLGFSPATLPERRRSAEVPDRRVGGLVARPGPHATYSTHPELLVAACRPGLAPASIHVAEDPGEIRFLEDGTGPFAELLDRFGVDRRWFVAPNTTPVGWLDRLGVLGPGLLLVHGVHLTGEDRERLVARGAPLVLCPRSNLHIGGLLPDVPALLEAGVRLALGTDSLASSPDLDVFGEVEVLARRWPEVPSVVWWRLATEGGADALGLPDVGRLVVGARAVFVHLRGSARDTYRWDLPGAGP